MKETLCSLVDNSMWYVTLDTQVFIQAIKDTEEGTYNCLYYK